jgi:hypothetical protein
MATIHQLGTIDARLAPHGYMMNSQGDRDDSEGIGFTLAHSFLERFFDLNIFLPRLTPAAIRSVVLNQPERRTEPPMRVNSDVGNDRFEFILNMAAATLEGNIGRVRQFMDEFRVVWRMLESDGKASTGRGDDQLTVEQAAKILLSLRCWPALRSDLYRRPRLLGELESIFIGEHPAVDLSKDPILERWTSVRGLGDLLRFGVASDDASGTDGGGDAIRDRLKTLSTREKFSFGSAKPETLLYAGTLT